MDLGSLRTQLEAAADDSRLRLLAALQGGECTVGDLVGALGQSQPRVSRHLRILAEAGLIESFREGRSILYALSPSGAGPLASCLDALSAASDPVLAADAERLQKLQRRRERESLKSSVRWLGSNETAGALELLASAVPEARALGDLLEVGCGSGALLVDLVPRARFATGLEADGDRRRLARARLRAAGRQRWTVRELPGQELPLPSASADTVLLNRQLPLLADARRVLRPGGRLLILDSIVPCAASERAVEAGLTGAGFTVRRRLWIPGRAPDRALFVAQARSAAHG
jgi:ArsR family transcriptional regulator